MTKVESVLYFEPDQFQDKPTGSTSIFIKYSIVLAHQNYPF